MQEAERLLTSRTVEVEVHPRAGHTAEVAIALIRALMVSIRKRASKLEAKIETI